MEQVQVDKKLMCKECGQAFYFIVRDQDFYRVHGFTDPKRCRPCRTERKLKRSPTSDEPFTKV